MPALARPAAAAEHHRFTMAPLWANLYTGGTWVADIGGGGQDGQGPDTRPRAVADLAFVIIDILLLFVVNFWMSIQVGKARKQYGVDYPNMYAYRTSARDGHIYKHLAKDEESLMGNESITQADADAYNSVQRAHQNTVENMPL
eukprot:COSAG05_NODE_2873_length_2554_cov_1.866802_1_plen_144_part_00